MSVPPAQNLFADSLNLWPDEAAMIEEAAAPLPLVDRARFREIVMQALENAILINPAVVKRACTLAQRALMRPPVPEPDDPDDPQSKIKYSRAWGG
jgi:hypothetical protein